MTDQKRYVTPPATRELEVLATLWGWAAFICGGASAAGGFAIAAAAFIGNGTSTLSLYLGLAMVVLSPLAGLPATTVAAELRSRIRTENYLARMARHPAADASPAAQAAPKAP